MIAKVIKVEKEMMGKFPKYEVESAADTLQRAMEIKKDKELMAQVSKVLKKKIRSLDDLRELANAPREDEDMEDEEMDS